MSTSDSKEQQAIRDMVSRNAVEYGRDNERMTCSIITITYNNLDGLRRTAESVAAQTYADMEWIVVDGGSTDGTREWLQKMKDESCRNDFRNFNSSNLRILSEPDRGVYDAQNKGIGMAKGEYCFFLNAGDCFAGEDVLERLLAEPVEADIVYGNEVVVDADGKRVGYCKGVENPGFVDLYNSCMKHQATLIRRALFERYGVYDSTLRICADWDWFFRVIGFHDEVSLFYRDVDVSLFENTGLSYHSPELCRRERQEILDRYMSKRLQQDYAVYGRYPRIAKMSFQRLPRLLVRIANRLLK